MSFNMFYLDMNDYLGLCANSTVTSATMFTTPLGGQGGPKPPAGPQATHNLHLYVDPPQHPNRR